MKNVWIALGILVVGFVGLLFFLHHDGTPSEWERRREAHAQWKQSAVEPVVVRPESMDQLRMVPTPSSEGVELRQPASASEKTHK